MSKPTYWIIVETLMDVINQSCTFPNGYLSHSFMGAYESAFQVLEDLGVLKEVDGHENYVLLWKELERARLESCGCDCHSKQQTNGAAKPKS
jgi:hypothetical protein